ncbi:hypothetical protein AMR41_05790, partial [Hapalosiphon sp. MRB220]
MQITKNNLKLYSALKDRDSKEWLTSQQWAELAGITKKTSVRQLRQFINGGIVEEIILHPTHFYRMSENAYKTETGKRLEEMISALNQLQSQPSPNPVPTQ